MGSDRKFLFQHAVWRHWPQGVDYRGRGWYAPSNECWGGRSWSRPRFSYDIILLDLIPYPNRRDWCFFNSWVLKSQTKGPGVPFSRLTPSTASFRCDRSGHHTAIIFCQYIQLLSHNTYLKGHYTGSRISKLHIVPLKYIQSSIRQSYLIDLGHTHLKFTCHIPYKIADTNSYDAAALEIRIESQQAWLAIYIT